MARKRTPPKTAKSATSLNGSSVAKAHIRDKASGGDGISGDVTTYARWFLLIALVIGLAGFLLYPDILTVVKRVKDGSLSNLAGNDEDHASSPEHDQNLVKNDDHYVEKENIKLDKNGEKQFRSQRDFINDHDDDDEDENSDELVNVDDGENDSLEVDHRDEGDLMEDEEEDFHRAEEKPAQRDRLETGKHVVSDPAGEKVKTASGEHKRKGAHGENDKDHETKGKLSANDQDKTLSEEDIKAKTQAKHPPRRPGSKTGPIYLTAENNQVVIDPSNIKIVTGKDTEDIQQTSTKSKSNKSPPNSKTSAEKDTQKTSTGKDPKKTSTGKDTKKTSTQKDAQKTSTQKDAQKTSTGKDKQNKKKTTNKTQKKDTVTAKESNKLEDKPIDDDVMDEAKKFKPTIHKTFTPKKIFAGGRRIPPVELLHQKESNSSVKVFLFDGFLSEQECDGLRQAHDKHVEAMNKPPILCFDSIATLRKHIQDAKKKVKVTPNDFTRGTKCVNASFSLQLQSWLQGNWSYSTAFYPNESTFSKVAAYRIQQAMGLDPSSGGKFQITSYPVGKAYKEHTDCTIDGLDKRDRVVSVLMYLSDVEEGGETAFPDLGIWVKPKKGRALVWNNMSPEGVCEPHSKHIASVVKKGSKYILIRWYYYKTFYSLGKRPPPPHLPEREEGQPMVNCDEYNSGSCRWYDEWSYEPLMEYEKNRLTLV